MNELCKQCKNKLICKFIKEADKQYNELKELINKAPLVITLGCVYNKERKINDFHYNNELMSKLSSKKERSYVWSYM